MARNNGILVNDFRKMVLDGHINEVIKALRYDDHDLVAQINKTLKTPSVKSNSREETFHTIFTNNVLSCPIDFVSITVTTRQYPLNTVIYTFDVMYYNDAITHMDIDMSDYCDHKITVSSVGLYTRKFSNWVMDVANDIRESMISAWKFAGNHVPDFIAAFDEVLDERKAEGIDINELYGADIPANDTEGDTSDTTTKDTKDSDDIGMKIITVKNPENANKIIKTVTDFVKDFRKDPTSTADDLMDKINSFLDAEAIEHTIRDIEQENTTDDDGIQDEQSDPNREPEPDDDIHEPVEEESDEEECNECCDCCDRCMNNYNLYSINTAEHFTSILDRAFSSQLLNNIQNYMVRNKLTKYEVELIPNSVNITATSKVILTMNRFYFNYKKLDSSIGGSVSIGVYNREKNTCYYKVNYDFKHVTLNDIKTIYVDNLTDMSIPQREEQIFHAIIDYVYDNLNYSTIFFAVAYAEGWDVNDPDFEFDHDLTDGIDRHFYDSIHGSVFADIVNIGNPDNMLTYYMDPSFSEFYYNLDERTHNAYDTDDDWYEDDDDDDDEDADYDDIMSEKNGYFMTDIDSKED